MIVSINDGSLARNDWSWEVGDYRRAECRGGCPRKIAILEVMVASVEVSITISDNGRYPLGDFISNGTSLTHKTTEIILGACRMWGLDRGQRFKNLLLLSIKV